MSVTLNNCGVQFPDSTVQCTAFTGGGRQYVCGLACNNINAGDPVSMFCANTGAVCTTLGYAPVQNLFCCSYTSQSSIPITSSIKFSECCFASLEIIGGFCVTVCTGCCAYTTSYYPGYVALRGHNINSAGIVTTTLICCLFPNNCYLVTQTGGAPLPIPGCSGTTGAFLTQVYCCNTPYYMETFLCYCTTNQTISLLRNCFGGYTCICGAFSYASWLPYVTPDRKYYMNFIFTSCCPYGECSFCQRGVTCTSVACSFVDLRVQIRATTDSACYLNIPSASSCTVALKSILPATCVWFATSWAQGSCGVMGVNDYNVPGFSPFSYGPDGWLLFHNYVCNCSACNFCNITFARYFAIKPIGDACYALTCNYLNAESIGVPFSTGVCGCAGQGGFMGQGPCTYGDAGVVWDQGDCIKRQVISFHCCVSTGFTSPGTTIACFCVNSTPCLVYLANTSCSRPVCCFACCGIPPGNWQYNQLCGTRTGYTAGIYGYNGAYTGYGSTGGIQSSRIWSVGSSSYLYVLYQTAIPYCYQCACYYFMTTPNASAGTESQCCCIGGFSFLSCACYGSCLACLSDTIYLGTRGQFRYCNWALNFLCSGSPIFGVDCCYTTGQCVVSYAPGQSWGYTNYPILMQSGNYMVGISNDQPFCSVGYSLGAITLVDNLLVAKSSITTTVSNWVGIAQNTVSAGGTVCYATPGMVDASPFSCCVCNLIGSSGAIIAGWWTPSFLNITQGAAGLPSQSNYWSASYCSCINACLCGLSCCAVNCYSAGLQNCPGNGLVGGNTYDYKYNFNYYNDNISFTPVYDTGLAKWTTVIDKHPKNPWAVPGTCICFAAGLVCCYYF